MLIIYPHSSYLLPWHWGSKVSLKVALVYITETQNKAWTTGTQLGMYLNCHGVYIFYTKSYCTTKSAFSNVAKGWLSIKCFICGTDSDSLCECTIFTNMNYLLSKIRLLAQYRCHMKRVTLHQSCKHRGVHYENQFGLWFFVEYCQSFGIKTDKQHDLFNSVSSWQRKQFPLKSLGPHLLMKILGLHLSQESV